MTTERGPVGLVLAAGAGTRYGMPKALVRDEDGVPWLHLACATLLDGGCAEVVVVLGAGSEEAALLVPTWVTVVVAPDWSSGQAASLRAGLLACARTDAPAVVITLVDLPGLRPCAVRRVLDGPGSLRRATYDGAAGHPVLVGREHWAPLADDLHGDSGAAGYLAAHGVVGVDCTDLGGGQDVDRPRLQRA